MKPEPTEEMLEDAHKALSATQRELYDTIGQRNALRELCADAIAQLMYAQAAISVAKEDEEALQHQQGVTSLRQDFFNLAALAGTPMRYGHTQILCRVANHERVRRQVRVALV